MMVAAALIVEETWKHVHLQLRPAGSCPDSSLFFEPWFNAFWLASAQAFSQQAWLLFPYAVSPSTPPCVLQQEPA
jgi:hypothetical protein